MSQEEEEDEEDDDDDDEGAMDLSQFAADHKPPPKASASGVASKFLSFACVFFSYSILTLALLILAYVSSHTLNYYCFCLDQLGHHNLD